VAGAGSVDGELGLGVVGAFEEVGEDVVAAGGGGGVEREAEGVADVGGGVPPEVLVTAVVAEVAELGSAGGVGEDGHRLGFDGAGDARRDVRGDGADDEVGGGEGGDGGVAGVLGGVGGLRVERGWRGTLTPALSRSTGRGGKRKTVRGGGPCVGGDGVPVGGGGEVDLAVDPVPEFEVELEGAGEGDAVGDVEAVDGGPAVVAGAVALGLGVVGVGEEVRGAPA
jgi:hypothetical protein